MTLSIYILIALSIVAAEIIYDHWCWRQVPWKNDKPESTILRGVLMALSGIIIYLVTDDINFTLRCASVIAGTFFLTFDFSLNVSRWKDLPLAYYSPYGRAYKKYFDEGFNEIDSGIYAYNSLTRKQKIIYKITMFSDRFFYHGQEKKRFSYDYIWNRIPPQAELLVKGIGLWGGCYYYFN